MCLVLDCDRVIFIVENVAIELSYFQIKSMAEHLAKTDKLQTPRKLRLPEQFTDDVMSLVTMITRDIVDRYNKVGT